MMHIICAAVITTLGSVVLLYTLNFNVQLSKFVYNVFPQLRIDISQRTIDRKRKSERTALLTADFNPNLRT